MKILLVEDDQIINENICKAFTLQKHSCQGVLSAKSAREKLQLNTYDLLILDLNLPDGNGEQILRELRAEQNNVPVIILTAKDNLRDMQACYQLGADDYLVKPFPLSILVLKAQALIMRNQQTPATLQINSQLVLNFATKTVQKNGRSLLLTAREYAILELLALNRERFLSAEEIFAKVWHEEANPFTQSVKIHLSNLRKKLGNIISVQKGVGYKLVTEKN